jgi:TrpR-related protein YerC/YecD
MTPLKDSSVDELFEAILSLQNIEECHQFFEDLCTINEIISLSQRLSVAKKLDEGKTFSTITTETGASSATIGRVNRCLSYGTGGYRKVIDRLKAKEGNE